ncbi:MAG: nucleotidyl transferase AbiEii/AbiGii toxin family protein [Caldilineaceae bacterium]|nr:nucleotidyl transferase AbiEii/AbiGii toxin family protein [Caldilineaceae bacterium]
MIPYLEAQVAGVTPEVQRSLVREYLQMRILQSLQRAGAMIPLAFHGGTALRFLYQLPRYSEDLDFALERQRAQYDFRSYLEGVRRDLTADTYTVEIKVNDRKVVNSAFVRFRGLLYQLGITPHHDEIIAIKLEIDTNPPAHALLDTTLVQHHVDVHLQHHNQASLFAGKLHAILQRAYVKGRDWYDLYWYLCQPQWPLPNFDMLNQALRQSGWDKGVVTELNWRAHVRNRLHTLAWQDVTTDVEHFIIGQQPDFTGKTIERLLLMPNL